ncbi:hypothetical protein AB0K43_08400 [Kitasatospora sp. NPDC049258]|uniref:hypothetical protein n=1 Tax=Kitasatospora sp. NPDC049258 TaxID=3155394 RepID=UPI00342F50DA
MTGTAHHLRCHAARCGPPGASRPWRPWRAVLVRELRYSSERLRAAALEGRRPVPQAVRRSVAVYHFARSDPRGSSVAALARVEERRARQAVRRRLGLLRTGLVSDFAIEPGRHRHSARWLA